MFLGFKKQHRLYKYLQVRDAQEGTFTPSYFFLCLFFLKRFLRL